MCSRQYGCSWLLNIVQTKRRPLFIANKANSGLAFVRHKSVYKRDRNQILRIRPDVIRIRWLTRMIFYCYALIRPIFGHPSRKSWTKHANPKHESGQELVTLKKAKEIYVRFGSTVLPYVPNYLIYALPWTQTFYYLWEFKGSSKT